jgi:hypothetical protein
MNVTCIVCYWSGTHHDLIDDDSGEVDDETEDVVQLCPKCTSSFLTN